MSIPDFLAYGRITLDPLRLGLSKSLQAHEDQKINVLYTQLLLNLRIFSPAALIL